MAKAETEKPADGVKHDDAVTSDMHLPPVSSVKSPRGWVPSDQQTPPLALLDKLKGTKPPAGKADDKKKPPMDSKKLDTALAIVERIIDIVKGTKDVRNRLSAILDPKNPKTSSNLNADQVNMVIDSYWFYNTFGDRYKALKELADEVILDMLSLNGYGVEQAIKLTAAIEQSKLLGEMFGSTQEKKSRLPSFKKEATKQ